MISPRAEEVTHDAVPNGDTTVEPDETFFVQLYDPTGAGLGDRFGQAVIHNDDAP